MSLFENIKWHQMSKEERKMSNDTKIVISYPSSSFKEPGKIDKFCDPLEDFGKLFIFSHDLANNVIVLEYGHCRESDLINHLNTFDWPHTFDLSAIISYEDDNVYFWRHPKESKAYRPAVADGVVN